MIISALRASIVFGDAYPDLTVGAISIRRFAPHRRGRGKPSNLATGPKGRNVIAPTVRSGLRE